MGVDAGFLSRRRRGLILGASGLALLFGAATGFLISPSTFPGLFLGLMGVGVVLLVGAFIVMPRKR